MLLHLQLQIGHDGKELLCILPRLHDSVGWRRRYLVLLCLLVQYLSMYSEIREFHAKDGVHWCFHMAGIGCSDEDGDESAPTH